MRIFIAGGTGVLGRASVRPLIEAGHSVRCTARDKQKAAFVRSLGAEPIEVDLYNPDAVRSAIAGCDAVLRLTTKIPPLMHVRSRAAWEENNRLRTEGARILVDAALASQVAVYLHESITFVYQDGGDHWLTEHSPTDSVNAEILKAALDGELEAQRFTQSGGRGIVLRFAAFYGPDSPSTLDMLALAKKRMLFHAGRGMNYFSSIYTVDAGRAVAAALNVPTGTYNISDDEP